MAVNGVGVDQQALAQALVGIHADLEDRLIRVLTRALDVGDADAEDWATRKLLATAAVRNQLARLLTGTQPAIQAAVTDALVAAYAAGQATADTAILTAAGHAATSAPVEAAVRVAVATEASALTSGLVTTHRLALGRAMTTYTQVIQTASGTAVTGAATRRDAAQSALTAFAKAGVKGYTDRSGRSWDLTTYTEMATRKTVATTAINGHTDRLVERGYDLVQVSDSPEECPECRKWEGRVLSLTGNTADRPTIKDAEDGGLFHPGCTHSVRLYIPGVTKRPAREAMANPDGYKDRQRLRALERSVRAAKREQLAAATPDAKQAAASKVRNTQARIREHVASTDQFRAPHRESLTAAR